MRYEIILAPQAVEDFKALKAADGAAVRDSMEQHLRHEPEKTSKSRIKRLRGMRRPQYRLRVDDIRISYDVVERRVEVFTLVAKPEVSAWLVRHGEQETPAEGGEGT